MGRNSGRNKRKLAIDSPDSDAKRAAESSSDVAAEGSLSAEWVELEDPKLRSRLLYANPVCILTTVDEERRRRNAMVVSWLTPINNHGCFVVAINKQRHSASLLLARRAFALSPAVHGMEEMLVAIGRSHGHLVDKFSEVEGLVAASLGSSSAADVIETAVAHPSAAVAGAGGGNPFALLDIEEGSESEEGGDAAQGAAAEAQRCPPALCREAGVVGAAAHLECEVSRSPPVRLPTRLPARLAARPARPPAYDYTSHSCHTFTRCSSHGRGDHTTPT